MGPGRVLVSAIAMNTPTILFGRLEAHATLYPCERFAICLEIDADGLQVSQKKEYIMNILGRTVNGPNNYSQGRV